MRFAISVIIIAAGMVTFVVALTNGNVLGSAIGLVACAAGISVARGGNG